jgi:hypothetical protein
MSTMEIVIYMLQQRLVFEAKGEAPYISFFN